MDAELQVSVLLAYMIYFYGIWTSASPDTPTGFD